MAKQMGAQLIKNSGRGIRKGDALWRDFVVDYKEGKSFTVNEKVWAKICGDTLQHGASKNPLIVLQLPNGAQIAILGFRHLKTVLEDCDESS
jgi:hypothetical protein